VDDLTYRVLSEGMRIAFSLIALIVLVGAASGLVIAILQTATSIRENAAAYAVKLLAVSVLIYLTLPAAADSILSLIRLALS